MDERIEIVVGDITQCRLDAIVNPTNSSLLGGGGADGAIHRRAGPGLLEECRSLRLKSYPEGLPTGKAVLTAGYNLPAAHVIHTVGPIWRGGGEGEDESLKEAYSSALALARDHHLTSLGFPAISTGIYGFPKKRAAKLALEVTREFLSKNEYPQKVVFIFFTKEDKDIFNTSA